MNKKQAIVYAQITLNYMQSSKYDGEINPQSFGVQMKQCFKLYPRDIVLTIADAQIASQKKLESINNGCDIDE